MPNWSVSPTKLDREQNDFLDHELNNRNHWISGFPGSGKSTILYHAIRRIQADNVKSNILIIVYTVSLREMFRAAFREQGIQEVRIDTMYDFEKNPRSYDYIFCDECQDITATAISKMKQQCKHLILAGDEHQSLYKEDVRHHEVTVDSANITSLINGTRYELTYIHRLSPAIQSAVQRLEPSLDMSGLRNMSDHSTQIRLCRATSQSDEYKYIWREARKGPSIGQTSAILFPTQKNILQFVNDVLQQEGKKTWQEKTNTWGKLDFDALND